MTNSQGSPSLASRWNQSSVWCWTCQGKGETVIALLLQLETELLRHIHTRKTLHPGRSGGYHGRWLSQQWFHVAFWQWVQLWLWKGAFTLHVILFLRCTLLKLIVREGLQNHSHANEIFRALRGDGGYPIGGWISWLFFFNSSPIASTYSWAPSVLSVNFEIFPSQVLHGRLFGMQRIGARSCKSVARRD